MSWATHGEPGSADVSSRPFLVLVELTRSCSLACRHCRAESVPSRDPNELRAEELAGMLDDLASLGAPRPRVVFSGGDPLRRPDLDDLIRYGAQRSLSMAVSPAGTPLASPDSARRALRSLRVRHFVRRV